MWKTEACYVGKISGISFKAIGFCQLDTAEICCKACLTSAEAGIDSEKILRHMLMSKCHELGIVAHLVQFSCKEYSLLIILNCLQKSAKIINQFYIPGQRVAMVIIWNV